MAQFFCVAVKRHVDPAAMKIRGFDAHTGVNQHLCGLDAVGFHGHTGFGGADAGKHFAADFPGVMLAAPRVGQFCPRKGGADGVDGVAAHADRVRHRSELVNSEMSGLPAVRATHTVAAMNTVRTIIICCCITC